MADKPDYQRRHMGRLLLLSTVLPSTVAVSLAETADTWHIDIAKKASRIADKQPLRILIPNGSGANVRAATSLFQELSNVVCEITEVPVDNINVEMILSHHSGEYAFDVALPATFGLPDLIEAGAIHPLSELQAQYEPDEFEKGLLYRKGDIYDGGLYGYQTDGDAYLMFYNKRLLEDPEEQSTFEKSTGRRLEIPRNWQQLDELMAFFHRPEENLYGGCLFRNSGYLVWEWWARLHAKGVFPFADDMTPNIDNELAVQALQELMAATEYLTPGSSSNGLFANWEEFAQGNVFCNIGWGGTQKYLVSQSALKGSVAHAPLPGFEADDAPSAMGYFNWGWDYTVSTQSARKDLAYLLCLFCVSPVVSSLAVSEIGGYFDPFRENHYLDPRIKAAYGQSFLTAHRQSMQLSIPDLYIRGQGSYLTALRVQLSAAMQGEKSPAVALKTCAKQWRQITRQLGPSRQVEQWLALKSNYPDAIANAMQSG